MQPVAPKAPTFLLAPENACSYLPGKTARMVFVDPGMAPQNHVYSRLAQYGFRRSGPYLYRPGCANCQACIPVRIPVDDFKLDRGQRRTWQRNQGLHVHIGPTEFLDEHFNLYQRYMGWRHPDGGIDKPSVADYASFLTGNNNTFFLEFRLQKQLIGVAVVDVLDAALSAVYTFYTPELPQRSLGTYAILWQIAEAQRRGLRWLYLGYWIAENKKMAYKSRFRPFEQLTASGWTLVI